MANHSEAGTTRASAFAGAAGLALRRPANWIQLAKFCLVGASGYVVNLAIYSALVLSGFPYVAAAGYAGVTVHVGDGSLGLPEHAPYDAIVVAAAAPELPMSLYEQLVPRGRLVAPIGTRDGQRLEVAVRSPEGPAILRSVPCRFVPLVGAEGYAE